ncbi:hypothetical protein C5167_018107 [Papaver somniferum]|uniref:Uncharacterized protein n=1 Tax=Papaver somniferum TaxID=3469 RepID=A0A4Y7ILB3_PAPSO|nr:hypothetical protein C5167_018107 [Papaver somniferum]
MLLNHKTRNEPCKPGAHFITLEKINGEEKKLHTKIKAHEAISLIYSSSSETVFTKGLVVILLGECVIYNRSAESGKDSFMVVDAISQKIGLYSILPKFELHRRGFLRFFEQDIPIYGPCSATKWKGGNYGLSTAHAHIARIKRYGDKFFVDEVCYLLLQMPNWFVRLFLIPHTSNKATSIGKSIHHSHGRHFLGNSTAICLST